MKTIFTLFLISLSLILIGQEKSDAETESKFLLGLTVSPQMSFAGLNSQDFTSNQSSSRMTFSWSTGMKSRYIFTKTFSTEIGIFYQQRNYKSGIATLIFGSQIDPLGGPVTGTQISDDIQLNSVAIPVNAVFTIVEKWNIRLGTRLNFYTEKSRERTVTNIPEGEDEELFLSLDNEINTSPIEMVFGFGRSFNLGNFPSDLNLIFSYNFNDIEIPVGGLSTIQSNLGLGWTVWFN